MKISILLNMNFIIGLACLVLISCASKPSTTKDAKAYSQEGNAHAEKQEFNEAIESYEKAIELEPNDAESYYNVATVYYEKQDYGNAIEAYKKVVELKPNSADTYFYLGNSYCFKKDYKKAIECFKKVLKLNPDYEEAHYNMEMASEMLKGKK